MGNVALVSHNSPLMEGEGYWFDDWTIGGSKFLYDDARAFGPILAALYTVSDGTLKMTAQMPPIGENDTPTVGLELMLNGDWVALGKRYNHTWQLYCPSPRGRF